MTSVRSVEVAFVNRNHGRGHAKHRAKVTILRVFFFLVHVQDGFAIEDAISGEMLKMRPAMAWKYVALKCPRP